MTRKLLFVLPVLAASAATLAGGAFAAGGVSRPPTISDSQLKATFTTVGGGGATNTTRTIPHWHGTTLNPVDGVTYGYNMAGADPNTCSGSACDVTIQADITPLIVNVDGFVFDASVAVPATLASPLFATNDYRSTSFATTGDPTMPRGPGGTLSQGDAGNQLQLEDATMRAQFDRTGTSSYHLRLHPNVLPSVTINVPPGQAALLQSGRGVVFADLDSGWWSPRLKNLMTKSDPTHLQIFLTSDVLLHEGKDILNCCVIGFHGASNKAANGNGNQPVQTFAWATYLSPGIYARPGGGAAWALQDIHSLSHEIAEWGDDPFDSNTVQPWLTATAPQYGCTSLLETGDPVVGIGVAMGTNTYLQGPNPNGTQSADGYYHPEDEVFLPWFMRTAPNDISEPTQSPSTDVGRYTLMGDLNQFAGFSRPATGC